MRKCFALSMVGWLLGCGSGGGGGGDLSFEEMCDRGASAMCEKASRCGLSLPKAECMAQGKALYCADGVEQYCGVGMTFQSSKAPACLDALASLACTALDTIPSACTSEALCASQGGVPQVPSPGASCEAVREPDSCDPKASLCYAAGSASSCTGRALCVGDGTGMTCAAACQADADCLAAGTGLVCLQGCTASILNGYCITPKAKAKFMDRTCVETSYVSSTGMSGWSL